jgi:hypothetical protein
VCTSPARTGKPCPIETPPILSERSTADLSGLAEGTAFVKQANTSMARGSSLPLAMHVAWYLCITCFLHTQCGAQDAGAGAAKQCKLPKNIRPVVYAQGFLGSALFNSSNEFNLEFLDANDFAPNSTDGGAGDLDLPLQWNENNLTQAQSAVGPAGSAGDILPGLEGVPNAFITQVCLCASTPDLVILAAHAASTYACAARSSFSYLCCAAATQRP